MVYPQYQQFKSAKSAMTPLPPTGADIEGPFYLEGAPVIDEFVGLCPSPTLSIHCRVLSQNRSPISGAVLDVWQADEQGVYDEHGFKLRGKIVCGKEGEYMNGQAIIKTIRPGDYQIADNPPDFRCAHIHVKVTADGYKPLTTQLYFADDQYNATDHWFDPKRIIPIANGIGKFDFVLA